jgi:hypothetical protein
MLKRYDIIALDDLRARRREGQRLPGHTGQVIALDTGTRRKRAE